MFATTHITIMHVYKKAAVTQMRQWTLMQVKNSFTNTKTAQISQVFKILIVADAQVKRSAMHNYKLHIHV